MCIRDRPKSAEIAVKWFDAKLKEVNEERQKQFKDYRISEALMTVYKLFWDEFSSCLLYTSVQSQACLRNSSRVRSVFLMPC